MSDTVGAPIIDVRGLSKSFGSVRAVNDLSFSVAKGEILGFLGPNGAGKSTAMKMIAGFLRPDAGEISLCGVDVEAHPIAAQRTLGYLPEGAPSYGDMTPRSFLGFIAGARGFRGDAAQSAVARAAARAQLGEVLDRRIENLSKGFRRRVGLAQAILHDPPALVLDEPTDGLDPNQKFAVRRLIKSMAKEKAILISTHILEEVDALCTRAIIIDRGKLAADGAPHDLIARSRFRNAVTVVSAVEDQDAMRAALAELHRDADIRETKTEGAVSFLLMPKEGKTILRETIDILSKKDLNPRGVYAEAGRLDDVFRELTSSDVNFDFAGAPAA